MFLSLLFEITQHLFQSWLRIYCSSKWPSCKCGVDFEKNRTPRFCSVMISAVSEKHRSPVAVELAFVTVVPEAAYVLETNEIIGNVMLIQASH